MAKLLFIFEGDMPTVSITRDVWTHLSDDSMQSDFMYMSDIRTSDIDSHDVIVFIRPTNIYSWKIAKRAREAGHLVITFCDDDLLNLPKEEPMMPWRRKGFIKCLNMSDVIWSSSQYILENYRNLTSGKRIAYSDTIIRPSELEGIETKHQNKKVKIVYAASDSHAPLIDKYIKPIVPKLVREFGNMISFTFVGVHPDIEGIDYEYVSGMPLMEYRRYMREQNFDIGLAPLHDDKFSKCKYFNKFIEYTTQGIVGIYSNTEPYTYVVTGEKNGFLADNNPEGWFRAIRTAIRDKNLREKCVENAIMYLQEHHSETVIMGHLKQEVPEMVWDHKTYKQCGEFKGQKIKHNLSRPVDWLYLTGFYLRKNGLRDVVERTKRRILGTNAYSRRENTI